MSDVTAAVSEPNDALSTPGASTSHLSYPLDQKPRTPSPPRQSPPPRELSKNRLYVGNLHPTVDEYTILQVFSKYGKVSKLDFLFHKSGPAKGKPRGYAFIEYSDKEDALRALINAHDKLLRGRKITVTYANHAPSFDTSSSSSRPYHRRSETDRPTTLSLLKNTNRLTKTEDKIAAMEAKLRQMERPEGAPSKFQAHPSLPSKPSASTISAMNAVSSSSSEKRTPSDSKEHTSTKHFPRKRGDALGLGRKPTLEELIKRNKSSGSGGLLSKK